MPTAKIQGTPLQAKVDKLIAEGISNRKIAKQFDLSEVSVRRYRQRKLTDAVKTVASVALPPDMPKDLQDEMEDEVDLTKDLPEVLTAELHFFIRRMREAEQNNNLNLANFCLAGVKSCTESIAKLKAAAPPDDRKKSEGMSPDLQRAVDEIIADSFKYGGLSDETLLSGEMLDDYSKGFRDGYAKGYAKGLQEGKDGEDEN